MLKKVFAAGAAAVLLLNAPVAQAARTLTLPEIRVNGAFQAMKADFEQRLSGSRVVIQQSVGAPLIGLAPMGASKLRPFKELDLDALVILDWNRPGSPETILADFTAPERKQALKRTMEELLNSGSLSSSTVAASSVAAQILAGIRLELGASEVAVSYYRPFGSSIDLSSWDGPNVGESDPALVTRFRFKSFGRAREIVYVAHKLTSDQLTSRSPMNAGLLKSLAPRGYAWAYLSADGVGLFSGKRENGLKRGSQELLEVLAPGGGVILDYPTDSVYTKCDQIFDGITFMCSRSPLETWGLNRVSSFAISGGRVLFGYSGLAAGDEVRVYQKPAAPRNFAPRVSPFFDFSRLEQVGAELSYTLTELRGR